ncbi:MAG TPA: response regulator [Bryobacteraceae bacterium]|nr:response regulator [Bryobacteraceae bacterium]
MDERPRILIVEDNSADVFLIRTAISSAGVDLEIDVLKDGEQAIQHFNEAGAESSVPCPVVVILDINLPKKDGGDVLRHIRKNSRCKESVVIVVSTSDTPGDRLEMAQLGANGYFHKPSGYGDFMKLGDMVKGFLVP